MEQENVQATDNLRNKEALIENLKSLLDKEDVLKQNDEVRALKDAYVALTTEEEKEQWKAFKAREITEDNEDDEFVFNRNPLDDSFYGLVQTYNERKKEVRAIKAEEEKQNLLKKTALIDRLKALVEDNMQNVGEAFKIFYEIRDEWEATGGVNKSKFKPLQNEYSHYRDLFYYNVGIHQELKNYDFKKNAEQKEEIIEQLKALLNQDQIKRMEKGVKELQQKWDAIGPTSNETWETLKNAYWDNVNAIYEKIKTHYKALRETQAKILDEKNELLLKAQNVMANSQSYKTAKDWIQSSEVLNNLHKAWKETGFIGKDKEEEIWNQFSEITNNMRNAKNDFFASIKEENNKISAAKNEIIAKAESIKDSQEWKKTGEYLIKLQKQWKEIGTGQYKTDQQLWEKFRMACDAFFTAKNEYFSTLDDRQEDNFNQKMTVVELIKKAANEEELKAGIEQWQGIGFVPKNKIKETDSSFQQAVKETAQRLGIDANQLNMLKFEAKVSALKDDDQADKKIKAEKQFIQTQIDKLKGELHRFDENLAFFGHSKGAQKLKEAVEKRMLETQSKIDEWKEKLKVLS